MFGKDKISIKISPDSASFAFFPTSAILLPMVVRMRSTRSHTGNRRSHHALKNPALTVDSSTGAVHLRHRASAVTGKYKGLVAIDLDKKLARKEKRAKAAQKAAR